MKLAVIDCGTNTFNLLIVALHGDNGYEKVFNTRIPVRLGEDSINEGYISEVPFMRGIDAISSMKADIRKHGVSRVLAFATSAIRDASNGERFVKEVNDLFGIEILVIDGEREAELIYYGIRGAVKLDSSVSLIMDIGGGSTEFILANDKGILWKQSFKIGAARILERFRHSSPITSREKQDILAFISEELKPLDGAVSRFGAQELIGSAGAFESIVEMIHGELGGEPLVPDEKTEYLVDIDAHYKISDMVFSATTDERKNIRGLVQMRVDMIVISCLMVNFILETFQLKKLRVSTYSLKEGALLDYIHNLKK